MNIGPYDPITKTGDKRRGAKICYWCGAVRRRASLLKTRLEVRWVMVKRSKRLGGDREFLLCTNCEGLAGV